MLNPLFNYIKRSLGKIKPEDVAMFQHYLGEAEQFVNVANQILNDTRHKNEERSKLYMKIIGYSIVGSTMDKINLMQDNLMECLLDVDDPVKMTIGDYPLGMEKVIHENATINITELLTRMVHIPANYNSTVNLLLDLLAHTYTCMCEQVPVDTDFYKPRAQILRELYNTRTRSQTNSTSSSIDNPFAAVAKSLEAYITPDTMRALSEHVSHDNVSSLVSAAASNFGPEAEDIAGSAVQSPAVKGGVLALAEALASSATITELVETVKGKMVSGGILGTEVESLAENTGYSVIQ